MASCYFLVIAAIAGWVGLVSRNGEGGLAGIWVLSATLPGSILALPTGLTGRPLIVLLVVISLLQTGALYAILRVIAARVARRRAAR